MASREILVRGPNWTGDAVMSTPAFRALRRHCPSDRITLQIRPGLAPLLAGSPWFDEVIAVESSGRGALALWREGRALGRTRRYDLGICLPDSWSSALLMRVAGVRRIYGYQRAGRGVVLHQPIAPRPEWGRRRLVARESFALELVRNLGCEAEDLGLELFTTDAEEAQADRALAASTGDGPLLLLAPGASFGPSKCWAPESFAEVGDAAASAGARVVLVGTRDEAPLLGRVGRAMHQPALELAGSLDLGGLKALVRRSAGLVCNDAGSRHIAVAFGVPCIVLMGPTSLEKTNRNLARVQVFETEVSCRPCYKRVCPIDHRCMTRLDVASVKDAALALLASPRSAAATLR